MNHTYLSKADYDSAYVLTIEYFDIKMVCKVVQNSVNPLTGTRTINYIPLEDTIHPYPLAFEPPLIEHAAGGNNGFSHHWEKLNYAFALPNPAEFPELPALTADDKKILRRFVKVCRQLAGYSALNDDGGLTLTHRPGSAAGSKPDVTLVFPTAEAFAGTAVAFRQLHNAGDEASFSRVQSRLMMAIKQLPEADRAAPKRVVAQWANARGKLMNRLLDTVVATKVGQSDEHPAPHDFPFSYCNINPDELIGHFQYGDTIHFGGQVEQLSQLLEAEQNAAYYKHAVLLAITGLSHLYFGFAVMAESAIGE